MKLLKAKPGDERLIHDQTADWVDRTSALSRLAADGRRDLEPVARQWLQDPDPAMAGEALGLLLTYWSRSPRVHDYVETAICWLETANDPDKRWGAAAALGGFLYLPVEYPKEEILGALLAALEHDQDESVQKECYKALLRHVAPQENIAFLLRGTRDFDRATDVRWELLAPLRERHGDR
jgi:hypothetical protein